MSGWQPFSTAPKGPDDIWAHRRASLHTKHHVVKLRWWKPPALRGFPDLAERWIIVGPIRDSGCIQTAFDAWHQVDPQNTDVAPDAPDFEFLDLARAM